MKYVACIPIFNIPKSFWLLWAFYVKKRLFTLHVSMAVWVEFQLIEAVKYDRKWFGGCTHLPTGNDTGLRTLRHPKDPITCFSVASVIPPPSWAQLLQTGSLTWVGEWATVLGVAKDVDHWALHLPSVSSDVQFRKYVTDPVFVTEYNYDNAWLTNFFFLYVYNGDPRYEDIRHIVNTEHTNDFLCWWSYNCYYSPAMWNNVLKKFKSFFHSIFVF